MTGKDFYLITCEHGGNRIPSRYRDLFRGHEALLRSHRGYDAGALRTARDMARALAAPLVVSTVSRLLVELNRSPGHRQVFSEATRDAAPAIRDEIFQSYYLPYRSNVEALTARAVDKGQRVVHVSCHSFTPALDGKVRNADIGLLYDPARPAEAAACRRWQAALRTRAASLKTRMNYPYAGTADGLTVYLRRRFPGDRYLGIELEINQKHVQKRGEHWHALRNRIIAAFLDAMAEEGRAGPPAVPGKEG